MSRVGTTVKLRGQPRAPKEKHPRYSYHHWFLGTLRTYLLHWFFLLTQMLSWCCCWLLATSCSQRYTKRHRKRASNDEGQSRCRSFCKPLWFCGVEVFPLVAGVVSRFSKSKMTLYSSIDQSNIHFVRDSEVFWRDSRDFHRRFAALRFVL